MRKATMKQGLCLLLAALLLMSLGACAAPSPAPAEESPLPAATPSPAPPETPAPTPEPLPTEEPAEVSPLLWKVTDAEGNSLYLFGTIHVGDQRNNTVLSLIGPVLESCDALAVEADTVAYAADTARAAQDMAQYVLTDGSTIRDHMPEELYRRAYDLLQEAGLFPMLFNRYNPALWSQWVESAALLARSDLDIELSMDELLIRRAMELEKPVLEVESPASQIELLNSFDEELYLLLIEETLDSLDSYGEDLATLYQLWLSGDREAFWAYLADEDADTSGYTVEQLALLEQYNSTMLDERNLGMRDKALEYLKSGQTVFFAVGAAHMANEAGLVQLLTDAGCTVEPVAYGDSN